MYAIDLYSYIQKIDRHEREKKMRFTCNMCDVVRYDNLFVCVIYFIYLHVKKLFGVVYKRTIKRYSRKKNNTG